MKQLQVYRVVVTVAWWWAWVCVPGIITMAMLGATPDWEKVERVLRRATRCRLVRVDLRVLDA